MAYGAAVALVLVGGDAEMTVQRVCPRPSSGSCLQGIRGCCRALLTMRGVSREASRTDDEAWGAWARGDGELVIVSVARDERYRRRRSYRRGAPCRPSGLHN